MIVTLTANPSLDRTIELPSPLERGAVQRGISSRQEPGGKGVNVSRALVACGVASLAVLPGEESDPVLTALTTAGVPVRNLPIGAPIRSNITLTEPEGTTTKVNEPGPALNDVQAAALLDLVVTASADAEWLVLAGSLPPGVPSDYYARVIRAVRSRASEAGAAGPRIALDTSGDPLVEVLRSGETVDLVKPNAEELAEAIDAPRDADLENDPTAIVAAAHRLFASGVRAALVTLGARGAMLVTPTDAWAATAPRIDARSTVGAGDCALAGYLLAVTSGRPEPVALAQAIAHGTAAASLPGSTVPTLDQIHPDRSSVTQLPSIAAGSNA